MYTPLLAAPSSRTLSPLVADIVKYIDANFAHPALPAVVLRRTNCSPRHLTRLFRREVGETIGRYLARVRVRHAAALVERGEKVEAVSLLVGYRSAATLFRHFHRLLGTTPRRYAGHQAPSADRACSAVAKARAFIDTHYAERLTLNHLAAVAGSSRRQLTTRFEREFGQTVHAYLTDVRIRRGAALVLSGERIEAVSLLVGYRSKKNFYRAFKSRMRMSPVEYRHAETRASDSGLRTPGHGD
jgi:AraC-like DNA-binding protein